MFFLDFISLIFALIILYSPVWLRWMTGGKSSDEDIVVIAPTLGIFGTFLGILIALFYFKEDAPVKMIYGIRFAFLTSIAGILISLWARRKLIKSRVESKDPTEEELNNIYKVMVEINNHNMNLNDGINGLRTEIKELSNWLKDYNKGTPVKSLIENLEMIINKYKELFESNVQSIEKIRSEIKLLGEVMPSVSKAIKDMKDSLERISELEMIFENITERMDALSKSLNESISRIPNLLASFSPILNTLNNGFMELMQQAQSFFEDYKNMIEKIKGSLEISSADLDKRLSELIEHYNFEIKSFFEQNKKMINQINDSLEKSLLILEQSLASIINHYNSKIEEMLNNYKELKINNVRPLEINS